MKCEACDGKGTVSAPDDENDDEIKEATCFICDGCGEMCDHCGESMAYCEDKCRDEEEG